MGKRKYDKKVVVSALTEAWAMGMNDKEACVYAGISQDYLQYLFKSKSLDLKATRDLIRVKPSMTARKNVVEKINEGDLDTSKWWLERKESAEFSTKNEQVIEQNTTVSIEDKEKYLERLLEKF